jgi:UDP-N-acetylglucosamine 2-epimerase
MKRIESMSILVVVGARPQFVKAAPLLEELRSRDVAFTLLHTGQHFDHNMSRVFFEELNIPQPDINLDIHGGNHGEMTGAMLAAIEREMTKHRPRLTVVFGDTNSTLAASLAAAKLHIPVAHIEAGLRSFNRRMPEEINRVLTDHLSTWLFCPTQSSIKNLGREGISRGVHLVGDIMLDIAERVRSQDASVRSERYHLATIHRAENTDDPGRLRTILGALGMVARLAEVVLPLHPRTRAAIDKLGVAIPEGIRVAEPLGYVEMLALEAGARAILTDSGGVQKEAYFLGVPCITIRSETEWTETVEAGWNAVTDVDAVAIVSAAERADDVRALPRPNLFGDGRAAKAIVDLIARAKVPTR